MAKHVEMQATVKLDLSAMLGQSMKVEKSTEKAKQESDEKAEE